MRQHQAQMQIHGQQQTAAGGVTSTPIGGTTPLPGLAKQPYSGPAISGSQIEGNIGTGKVGKLGNIMKKMREGPTRPDSSMHAQH